MNQAQPDIHQQLIISAKGQDRADVLKAVTSTLEAAGLTVYPAPTAKGEDPRIALDPGHVALAVQLLKEQDFTVKEANAPAQEKNQESTTAEAPRQPQPDAGAQRTGSAAKRESS